MIDSESGPIVDAKRALMAGLTAAIKSRYENPHQAAQALDMPPANVYRITHGNHKEHSLAWLIQTLAKLGAKVHIRVELGKPEPIKEPVETEKRLRRSVR